ncbi:MAG: 4'-phosphopantetheinyl transferase family protein [Gemmataceae bacterium]
MVDPVGSAFPSSFWPGVTALPSSLPNPGEVWVWSFTTIDGTHIRGLENLLDEHECQRAQRLRSARARAEFVSGRGLVRLALGKLMDLDPRSVQLSSIGNGKPVLAAESVPPLVHFNLAHSHGMGLLALSIHAELGVDIEKIRAVADMDSLARRYFHPNEVAKLRILEEDEARRLAFFHAWTRKEAFLKATAAGIGFGLDRVEVTLGGDQPARLVRIDGSEEKARNWTLEHLAPSDGWMAALALQAPCTRLVTGHILWDSLTG